MQLLRAWLYGYIKPYEMIRIVSFQTNPSFGLVAVTIRGLLDSLLLYLPVYLMGRLPSQVSYLTFVDTKDYFLFLVFVSPFFFILLWLFLSGSIYLILRLTSVKHYEIDHILNIFGVVSLIVGAFVVIWDWFWIVINSKNFIWLGVSHQIINLWSMFLITAALKKILNIKIFYGIILTIIWILLSIFPAILIMKSPL